MSYQRHAAMIAWRMLRSNEPVGGCPASDASIDAAQIDQVVQGVVAELKRRGEV